MIRDRYCTRLVAGSVAFDTERRMNIQHTMEDIIVAEGISLGTILPAGFIDIGTALLGQSG